MNSELVEKKCSMESAMLTKDRLILELKNKVEEFQTKEEQRKKDQKIAVQAN